MFISLFHSVGNIIISIDELICFRGVCFNHQPAPKSEALRTCPVGEKPQERPTCQESKPKLRILGRRKGDVGYNVPVEMNGSDDWDSGVTILSEAELFKWVTFSMFWPF